MNFSSDNIQLFLAVLDRGSFSAARAPRAVGVSMAIGNLEADLATTCSNAVRVKFAQLHKPWPWSHTPG
jgi:hypothetical protein